MSYTSLRREPCPECGSSDNLVVYEYDDGRESYHCFTPGCTNHKHSPEVYEDRNNTREAHTPYKYNNTMKPVDLTGWINFPADMKTRGIEKKWLTIYNVQYKPKGKLLGFPYYREPHYPTAIKYRTVDKKFGWYGEDTKDPWLFGRQTVSPNRKVLIITEGELDAIAAAQMTGYAAVSVPNGAQGALKSLKYNLKWIEQFEKIYICFDSDEAGLAASEEAMTLIKAGQAYQVILDLKDPCEYLLAGKGEEFKQKLHDARCRTTDALYDPRKLEEDYLKYIYRDPEDIKGKKTGIKALDEVFRLRKSEVTTLFADPTVGKSSVARQIAANWLVQEHGGILYFAFEESSVKWIDKLVDMLCDGDFSPQNKQRIYEKYRDGINSSSFYSFDLKRIREAVDYCVRSRGCSLVIFDNVTAACSGVGEYNETVRALYNLFVELGKSHEVHTLVVSHTKRDGNLKAGSPPYLTSAYGSSGVEQFSDNVIALGREEGSNFTTVAIRKQRDTGEVGELTDQLEYDKTLKRFKGLDLGTVSIKEESPGDKDAKKEKDSTRTAQSDTEEPRVSRRQSKDGQVRQQDGEKGSRGDKGGLPKSSRRENRKSDETIFGRDPFAVELQSGLHGSPTQRAEALLRMQRASERARQTKITKPSRIPERQSVYDSPGCRPYIATPYEDVVQNMGGKVRDYSNQRR